jgi:hypothetical protein
LPFPKVAVEGFVNAPIVPFAPPTESTSVVPLVSLKDHRFLRPGVLELPTPLIVTAELLESVKPDQDWLFPR